MILSPPELRAMPIFHDYYRQRQVDASMRIAKTMPIIHASMIRHIYEAILETGKLCASIK